MLPDFSFIGTRLRPGRRSRTRRKRSVRRRPRRRRNGASLSECYGGPAFACCPRVEPRVERGEGVRADVLALDRGDPPRPRGLILLTRNCVFSLCPCCLPYVSRMGREKQEKETLIALIYLEEEEGEHWHKAAMRHAYRLSPAGYGICDLYLCLLWRWRWRRSARAADCGGVNEATSTRRRPSAGGALAVASA